MAKSGKQTPKPMTGKKTNTAAKTPPKTPPKGKRGTVNGGGKSVC